MKTTSHSNEAWLDKSMKRIEKLKGKDIRKMTIHEFVINEILTLREKNKKLVDKLETATNSNRMMADAIVDLMSALRIIGLTDCGDHFECEKTVVFDKTQVNGLRRALKHLEGKRHD